MNKMNKMNKMKTWLTHYRRAIITAIPLVLVNIVAVSGQFAFLSDHLSWPPYGIGIFAAAIESTALYLAYMAHESLIGNDSALRLRLGSYTFGLIAGLMNYSHYSQAGKATFVAIATGLMSASSPFLWGIYSRRQSRDALMRAGLIEPHAVRLGATRVMWHPVKSASVMYAASWLGVQSPSEAIALIEPGHAALKTPLPDMPVLADMETQADSVRFAVRSITQSTGTAPAAPEVAAWLQDHAGELRETVVPAPVTYVRDVLRRDSETAAKHRRGTVHALGSGDSRRTAAGT